MIKCALAAAAGLLLSAGEYAIAGGSPCDADLNHDGVVNTLDLGILLSSWTLPPATACSGTQCQSDLDGNGVVNTLDLGILLSAFGSVCNQPTETELAGNSTALYPFFEYSVAFNVGAPVQVALDPTRFPSIVGDTANIYIVADKSAAQWAANPSLVDLTPGGAMTVTFAAGTIQANTFTVDTGTLSGAAGTGIGIPYDVVVDMNQNGVLDSSDFIDGLSGAGGMYVVADLTLPGPLAVTQVLYTVTGITSGLTGEDTFYPSNIAAMGQLPLVIVSHGNGHNYTWYDHIGNHLGSYGYIVMSHMNDTVPGPFNASTTTLEHTNAIIGQQATIAGGVLNGHIDATKIVWIGHSRGAEGVAIAYDRVFDATFTPVGWSLSSIKLISSMCPTDFNGTAVANPHNANYHLWTAAADADVNGCASSDIGQTWHLLDRATDYRQSICLYGVGHGDLHNFPPAGEVATGPCLIGRPNTHAIMRGYLLPLVKHYVEGNIPAKDFLWRQWERFRPVGAPSLICPATSQESVVVNLQYRDAPSAGNFMIDDFQTQPSMNISSSGGLVTFNVTNLTEGRFDDNNADFTANPADPMNGMTEGAASDSTSGIVFDWNTPGSFIEWTVVAAGQDVTNRAYLSFRACQATRHANTIAILGDLTYRITLRDSVGTTSTIDFRAFGGGIEEPYQRTGCGTGTGWHNDFEVVKIRLTDFLNNGSGLDPTHIVAVRMALGDTGPSTQGRIGVDELQFTNN